MICCSNMTDADDADDDGAPTATVFAAPEGCQASSNDDNPATTAIRQGTRYDDAC